MSNVDCIRIGMDGFWPLHYWMPLKWVAGGSKDRCKHPQWEIISNFKNFRNSRSFHDGFWVIARALPRITGIFLKREISSNIKFPISRSSHFQKFPVSGNFCGFPEMQISEIMSRFTGLIARSPQQFTGLIDCQVTPTITQWPIPHFSHGVGKYMISQALCFPMPVLKTALN